MGAFIRTIFNYLKLNQSKVRKIVHALFIILILFRFGMLNYVNWESGALTTGKPGVQTWLDTSRYLEGAEDITNGKMPDGRAPQYLGYILLIAFFDQIGIGITGVVILQVLLAIFATMAIFTIAKKYTRCTTCSIIAAGWFLINPFITTWHLFIMTESLYTSFMIFAVWSVLKAIKKQTMRWYIITVTIVFIAASIRPNGWILIPVTFSLFVGHMHFNRLLKTAGIVSIFFLFVLAISFIPSLNVSVSEVTPLKTLQKGEVVWGHPELRHSMPTDTTLSQNWTNGFLYGLQHPISTTVLIFKRIKMLLIQIRPWQSTAYKTHILIYLIPAYLLMMVGLFRNFRKKQTIVIASFIIAHIATIALTYASHESRFIIYILPLFYILAAGGLAEIKRNVQSQIQSNIRGK